MSNQKKLYALIVGINKYDKVKHLHQAVSDAEKVNAYLKKWCNQQAVSYQPLPLPNEKATRNAIIEGFQNHLTQAKSDDIALFYFSGHGSQEEMDEVFDDVEHDGKLETIIAVDSRRTGIPDIADKELRYLIHEVSKNQPHIITIFDCCHSGTNTRNPELVRRWSDKAKIRAWENFVFSKKYKTVEDFKAKNGTNIALPEGKHIQISACQNIELAYETSSKGGVFTNALLEVLERLNGGISYYSLRQRIVYAINRKEFRQTPQIYVSGQEQDIFQPFLIGSYDASIQNVPVVWKKSKPQSWLINVGTMHGLPSQPIKEQFPIEIYNQAGTKVADAFPKLVNFSKTYIEPFDEIETIDTNQFYVGKIQNLFTHSLRFYLDIADALLKNEIIQYFENKKISGVIWTAEEAAAQYVIRKKDNTFIITTLNDKRPLVKPLPSSKLSILSQYLDQIIKWEYALNLSPTNIKNPNPIQIEVSQHGQSLDINDKIIEATFDKPTPNSNKIKAQLQVTIKNTSRKDMHFALVGFTHQFGVYTNYLGEQVVKINARQSISVTLPFVLPYYIQAHQWEYSPTWLKVFAVSDAGTDLSLIAQDELPEPVVLRSTKRGGLKRRSDKVLRQEEWFVDVFFIKCMITP